MTRRQVIYIQYPEKRVGDSMLCIQALENMHVRKTIFIEGKHKSSGRKGKTSEVSTF